MPRFAVPAAPKCARCNTSVFLAEQVIGPAAKPYHKTCLTCSVCNKRLDSTLLVEHDSEPYCKNCHKEHLGTGKGGFSKAVALNPTSPKSPRSPVSNLQHAAKSPLNTPSRSAAFAGQQYPSSETPLSKGLRELARRSPSPTKFSPGEFLVGAEGQVPDINIRSRGMPDHRLASPPSPAKLSSRPFTSDRYSSHASSQQTPIRSIDEAISSDPPELRYSVAALQSAVGDMSISTPSRNLPSEEDSRREQQVAPTSTGYELPSVNYYDTPSPPISRPGQPQYSTETTIAEDGTPVTVQTRRVAASDTIGSIRLGNTISPSAGKTVNTQSPLAAIGQLPPAKRPDPRMLTGASGTAKIAPPRTQANASSGLAQHSSEDDMVGTRLKSGIDRIGLSSSIVDAGGGTPLCARCLKPVYFAEQKAAAGRKWHRACLRCDGCATTLESGKLEEGPAHKPPAAPHNGANVWCRICYAKYFGPKNLAVGLSLPETMH